MKKNIQNHFLRNKTLINLGIILLGAFLVSIILQINLRFSIEKKYVKSSEEVLNQVIENINQDYNDVHVLSSIFHSINLSTLSDLRLYMDQGMLDKLLTASDNEKCDLMADLILNSSLLLWIMDENGNIVEGGTIDSLHTNLVENGVLTESALETIRSDWTGANYLQIGGEDYSAFVYYERIYSSQGDYFLVSSIDADVLTAQLAPILEISNVLKNVYVGESGFLFAIREESCDFEYFHIDEEDLTGKNAIESGMDKNALVDGYAGLQTINGKKYLCVLQKTDSDYLIGTATPEEELYTSGSQASRWAIVEFMVISLICLLYIYIVRNDCLFNDQSSKKKKILRFKGKDYFFNHSILKRITPIITLGVIFVFLISFYSYTLTDVNQAISDSNNNIIKLESNFLEAENNQKYIKAYYEGLYLSKAKTLAYIFEDMPEVLNSERNKTYYTYDSSNIKHTIEDDEGNPLLSVSESDILKNFCIENAINAIYIFDEQGHTLATNTPYWYFTIGTNASQQSFPMRQVLDQKVDNYIQDMEEDENGEIAQYVGTTFHYYTTVDQNGQTLYVSRSDYQNYLKGQWTGNPITSHASMLEIAVDSFSLNLIISSTEFMFLLQNSSTDSSYFLLFDDDAEHTILFSPKEHSIGKPASEIGIPESAFDSDYIGFETINGISYLLCLQEYKGNYIGTALLKSQMYGSRLFVSVVTALFELLFVFAIAALITLTSEQEEDLYTAYMKERKPFDNLDRIMFRIATPVGNQSVAEKAVSRWDNKNIPWREKTPEQKLAVIFLSTATITILSLLIYATMVKGGKITDDVLYYIISGNWRKGINLFAITACGLVLIASIVAAHLLNIPIRLFTGIFGTKSETIGHLLASVTKYVTTIFAIFYSLYLLGVDASSLMTSAGILSLVIGLGSQSLIKDVVAGIFIIFEGSFRVGDIVTIGNYRGQVLDVGIRTTKIMGLDQNIKIYNNSEVSGVINMTRISSMCIIDVPIPMGVPIREVEEALKVELPQLKERVPGIQDGPFYQGVVSFDSSRFTVEFSVLCNENQILEVKSGLNREIVDLIIRKGLNKPKA